VEEVWIEEWWRKEDEGWVEIGELWDLRFEPSWRMERVETAAAVVAVEVGIWACGSGDLCRCRSSGSSLGDRTRGGELGGGRRGSPLEGPRKGWVPPRKGSKDCMHLHAGTRR